jgi:uncharacterized protein (TIGR00297 family)
MDIQPTLSPILAGLIGLATALVAWGARGLSASGVVAASLVGMFVLAGTGWAGGAVLATFFVGSTLVSRLSPDLSAQELDAKGDQRDAGQVLANGGVAAFGGLLALLYPAPAAWIVTASLTSAAADTWATSIGARSRSAPRDLITGRVVPPGTSGGVTWYGTIGALIGGATVAGVGAILFHEGRLFPLASLIGMGGMLFDSALGSCCQGRFQCPRCAVPCERAIHRCGTRATHTGGLRRLTNDGVNAAATVVAGMGGWLAWRLI